MFLSRSSPFEMVNCLPRFPHNEGSQSKSSDRVSPRFIPRGVHRESRKSNPSHIRYAASRGNRKIQNRSEHHEACQCESKPPAIRAARASPNVKRKRRNTTAAESSSIKLSPPKANSAALCEIQAVPRDTMASTFIHMSVMTWSLKNFPRNVRQRRYCRCAHKSVANYCTPSLRWREKERSSTQRPRLHECEEDEHKD